MKRPAAKAFEALAVAFFCVSGFGCPHDPPAHAPVSEEPIVHAPDPPAAQPSDQPPFLFANDKRVVVENGEAGGWQVSLAEGQRADAGVGAFLQTERPEIFSKLDDYVAQIYGVTWDDQKFIQMNFMCGMKSVISDESEAGLPPNVQHDMETLLLNGPTRCRDGGDCCFQLVFDPASGTYGSLHVNGHL